ncbi:MULTISPECIES: ATP-dependent DNA ligase [Actinokineospora]|uniref:ATP-dependent DNA ligase n=1 Tax=Actinokineospora fastidiosa TaxID=1816 RepID=A0A918GIF5_9PSEU|nr:MULTISPECIES: ATP-dependent DNA ligase [Actinokineospora]UVS80362.1 Putative DNA ligase-like protein [Actinokineospora sp. UTMC 2448]GGS34747.1 ATP-dependent DNA ligase [Actinokineospora fastidiosa]
MLVPPVELALARPQRRVPAAGPGWRFEPKFDGWRALLFTASGFVQSRRDNDLAARFPEIVAAGRGLGDLVLDGELVALREGRLDFSALTSAPRSRAGAGVAVYFVVFDILADADRDWRPRPYLDRRRRLTDVMAAIDPPLQLMPATDDRAAAIRRWMDPAGARIGIEGVVVKAADRPYRAGRTGDWVKVRHTAVLDAVVIGVTGRPSRPEEVVLARRDDDGGLRGIGLSLPLPTPLRDEVGRHVAVTGERAELASGGGFGRSRTEYLPVHPTLVVEVEAEASAEFFTNRLRPAVRRLRVDMTVEDV